MSTHYFKWYFPPAEKENNSKIIFLFWQEKVSCFFLQHSKISDSYFPIKNIKKCARASIVTSFNMSHLGYVMLPSKNACWKLRALSILVAPLLSTLRRPINKEQSSHCSFFEGCSFWRLKCPMSCHLLRDIFFNLQVLNKTEENRENDAYSGIFILRNSRWNAISLVWYIFSNASST